MKKSLLVASREFRERLRSKNFLFMAVFGPLIVLALIYLLLLWAEAVKNLDILIADPNGILENRIMAKESESIHYSFANDYIEVTDFANGKQFSKLMPYSKSTKKSSATKSLTCFIRKNRLPKRQP